MRDQIYSVGDLRAIIAPIAARHGVERIYLFGSYARGEATKNSDVDLRVDKGNLRGMFAEHAAADQGGGYFFCCLKNF